MFLAHDGRYSIAESFSFLCAFLLSYMHITNDIWSMGSLWNIIVVVLFNVDLSINIQCWELITYVIGWGLIIVPCPYIVTLDSLPGCSSLDIPLTDLPQPTGTLAL
jgi:hypothetical protein